MLTQKHLLHFACTVLAVIALVVTARYAVTDHRIGRTNDSLITGLENIDKPHGYDLVFQGLQPILPDQGTIGYKGNLGREAMKTDIEEASRYYQSQYALAPLILDYSTNHQYVVTILDGGAEPSELYGDITNSHDHIKTTKYGAALFKRR